MFNPSHPAPYAYQLRRVVLGSGRQKILNGVPLFLPSSGDLVRPTAHRLSQVVINPVAQNGKPTWMAIDPWIRNHDTAVLSHWREAPRSLLLGNLVAKS